MKMELLKIYRCGIRRIVAPSLSLIFSTPHPSHCCIELAVLKVTSVLHLTGSVFALLCSSHLTCQQLLFLPLMLFPSLLQHFLKCLKVWS